MPWRAWRRALTTAVFAAAGLHCNLVTSFTDCSADRDCRLGERCNPSGRYCEVPVGELCNGLDDDHDGVADEAEDFGPCDADRMPGMCRDGRRRCAGGRLTCVRRTSPQPETCYNGIDDDCNGTVDDGASCVQNYPASMAVRIGSNDISTGEGDDAPEHRVCVAPFSIDKHEVSNRAFLTWLNTLDPSRFMVGTPPARLNTTIPYGTYVLYNAADTGAPNWLPLVLLPQPTERGYDLSVRRRGTLFETLDASIGDLPVVNVTWIAADRYCRWAGKQLPSEAEFFRAMQGDNGARLYPWGNDAPTCARANVSVGVNRAPCVGTGVGRPLPVASLDMGTNPEGVFNLYGNVDEWMWDYLDRSSVTQPDGTTVYRNNYYASRMTDAMWCGDFPSGPLGPAMGATILEMGSTTVHRCTRCRFSRGRRYESTDLRPLIRKWMDADRAEPGIGFRCSAGGASR